MLRCRTCAFYLILLITTSARIGALLELTWDRVDLERRLIYFENPDDPVRRKKRADVPINHTAMAALQEAKDKALSPYVIEWGGKGVGSIKTSMKKAAARASLSDVSPHVLRHSAAVWMAEAGRDMEEIRQFLGHESIEVTRRIYAKLSPSYLAGAADVLELNEGYNRKGRRKT